MMNCPECDAPVNEGDELCPQCFVELDGDDDESEASSDSGKDPFFDDPLMLGVAAVIFWEEFY